MARKSNTKGAPVANPDLKEFEALLGELPDEKIAEMSGVSVAAVARARAEKESDEADDRAPADPVRGKSQAELEATAAEVNAHAPPSVTAEILRLAAAAKRLQDEGWAMSVEGDLIRPFAESANLVIQVEYGAYYSGKNARGKDVRIDVARSIYRGDMARTLCGLLDPAMYARVSG